MKDCVYPRAGSHGGNVDEKVGVQANCPICANKEKQKSTEVDCTEKGEI